MRRVVVAEGLTAESAAAKLAVGGTAPPLYRHVSVDRGHAARGNASAGVTGSTRRLRAEVEGILSAACADGSFIEQQRYGHDVRGDDPVEGLLELVRREYGLAPDAAFETVTAKATSCARTGKPRPAPLTLATAQQLGVLPTRSVPPLLSHVLPASAGAPAACRAYLQELLLHPPPRDVAAKISTAAAALTSSTIAGGVPRLEVTPPGKVAKLLRTREGSHVFFAEVVAMARAVRKTLTHDAAEIRTAGEYLLSPTGLKVGRRVDARALAERCAEAEAIIARVVAAEALEGGGACGGYERERARDDDEEGEHAVIDDDDDAAAFDADAFDDAHDGVNDAPARVPHVPRAFARFNEPWRGRVRRDVVATELAACYDALRALSLAIEEDLAPVIAAAEALAAAKTAKNRRCHLEHDARNNALWLRHVPASVARGEKIDGDDGAISPLIHPRDRYGKEISDRWSTPRVEAALDAYRVSSAACGRAVASRLKALADDLGAHVADLVAAATFSAIAVAVTLHATRATRRGWRPASLPPASDTTTPFKTVGLRPFWMDDAGPGSAVENDITLDGVSILTGPNMAGKSTVLRSAAACALLASCGLFVPRARGDGAAFRRAARPNVVHGLPRGGLILVRGRDGRGREHVGRGNASNAGVHRRARARHGGDARHGDGGRGDRSHRPRGRARHLRDAPPRRVRPGPRAVAVRAAREDGDGEGHSCGREREGATDVEGGPRRVPREPGVADRDRHGRERRRRVAVEGALDAADRL